MVDVHRAVTNPIRQPRLPSSLLLTLLHRRVVIQSAPTKLCGTLIIEINTSAAVVVVGENSGGPPDGDCTVLPSVAAEVLFSGGSRPIKKVRSSYTRSKQVVRGSSGVKVVSTFLLSSPHDWELLRCLCCKVLEYRLILRYVEVLTSLRYLYCNVLVYRLILRYVEVLTSLQYIHTCPSNAFEGVPVVAQCCAT